MRMRRTLYIFSFSLAPWVATAQTVAKDSIAASTVPVPKPPSGYRQLRLGADIGRFVFNAMYPSRPSWEVQADYTLGDKSYLALEAGWGHSKIDYPNLSYSNNSAFIRMGIDRSLLEKLGEKDFDIAFIGFRYGNAVGNRNEATYRITSTFGKVASGTVPAQSYWVHWGEVNAGIRVEVIPHLFLGWNLRLKFLLNPGTFEELAPNYIAGYGSGDKATAFDFNFYTSYAIRWKKGN